MRILFLIPARGGSKGLPKKNIKALNDKPLIYYTIDAVKPLLNSNSEICISTDSNEIREVVLKYGIDVPFMRPAEFSTDFASSEQVMQHALEFYSQNGQEFDLLILLQPTSPLRTSKHILDALQLFDRTLDMVVSVKETKSNPYFNLFEEDKGGFLHRSKESTYIRRQDCPQIYEYNGAIYIINVQSLLNKGFGKLDKVKKYVMSEEDSIDIDTIRDFEKVEKTFDSK